jgi:hypothetical protein
METHQILINQLVSDISIQAADLDDVRRQLFMEWLKAHHNTVNAAAFTKKQDLDENAATPRMEANIEAGWRANLKSWFESLPVIGMFWEYHLILSEILWWRNLDQRSLDKILKEHETAER